MRRRVVQVGAVMLAVVVSSCSERADAPVEAMATAAQERGEEEAVASQPPRRVPMPQVNARPVWQATRLEVAHQLAKPAAAPVREGDRVRSVRTGRELGRVAPRELLLDALELASGAGALLVGAGDELRVRVAEVSVGVANVAGEARLGEATSRTLQGQDIVVRRQIQVVVAAGSCDVQAQSLCVYTPGAHVGQWHVSAVRPRALQARALDGSFAVAFLDMDGDGMDDLVYGSGDAQQVEVSLARRDAAGVIRYEAGLSLASSQDALARVLTD